MKDKSSAPQLLLWCAMDCHGLPIH